MKKFILLLALLPIVLGVISDFVFADNTASEEFSINIEIVEPLYISLPYDIDFGLKWGDDFPAEKTVTGYIEGPDGPYELDIPNLTVLTGETGEQIPVLLYLLEMNPIEDGLGIFEIMAQIPDANVGGGEYEGSVTVAVSYPN